MSVMTQQSVKILEQYAKEVVDFSSQYGSDTSISYTAGNLAGQSNIYPKYGDFNLAFVLRTYGPWWNQSSSAAPKIGRTPESFISQDYVELWYDIAVYPTKVDVYETYHPGGIVKILACDTSTQVDREPATIDRWHVLWSGEPQQPITESRIFSPSLSSCPFRTNVIRLEFNHEKSDYYLELDCVKLSGTQASSHIPHHNPNIPYPVVLYKEADLPGNDPGYHGDKGSIQDAQVQLQNLTFNSCDDKNAPNQTNNGFFDTLPEEVIQLVLSHLDIPSLCNMSLVSRLFYHHCYDPLHFVELNLQPYYDKVNNAALNGFTARCHALQKINLSWCGGYGDITSNSFIKFIENCGGTLVSLRVACCRFINDDCVKAIARNCSKLQELDLACNKKIGNVGFLQLTKLSSLTRLNLYRTSVDVHSLVAIARCCPDLEHLNIGSCSSCNNFDDVAVELGNNCRNLKSLDVWRARTLTHQGLSVIASNCTELEELDAGWCSELHSATDCLVELIQGCRKLRKLYLTANRTVCDQDLEAIAMYSKDLEQLDILGTREVSAVTAQRVLMSCKKLRMFDVSFCAGISFSIVEMWRESFPHVDIKKSFQSPD